MLHRGRNDRRRIGVDVPGSESRCHGTADASEVEGAAHPIPHPVEAVVEEPLASGKVLDPRGSYGKREEPMADIVLINPKFDVSFWGLEFALPLLGKRAARLLDLSFQFDCQLPYPRLVHRLNQAKRFIENPSLMLWKIWQTTNST